MYASLALTPGITTGYARFLLRLADRLTFRQLTMIALIGRPDRQRFEELDAMVANRLTGSIVGITQELDELDTLGCLGVEGGRYGVASLAEVGDPHSFLGMPLANLHCAITGTCKASLLTARYGWSGFAARRTTPGDVAGERGDREVDLVTIESRRSPSADSYAATAPGRLVAVVASLQSDSTAAHA